MKSIEERANEFVDSHREMYSIDVTTAMKCAYIQGATDQMDIDANELEKVNAEWKENMRLLKKNLNGY